MMCADIRRIALVAATLLPALVMALLPRPARAVLCGTVLSPISVSVSPVNFGVYDPTSPSPTQSTGTITISCGLGVDLLPAFTVSLSAGSSGSFTMRHMTSGLSALNYNLYSSPAYSTLWGDGTGPTVTESYGGLVSLSSTQFTVYGQLPAGQFVPAGSYNDTIVITISY